MNDAILTYHQNPFSCGVAKFSHELARRMGVPCGSLADWTQFGATASCACPLVSVKPSEVPDWVASDPTGTYDLFLHDFPGTDRDIKWLMRARKVYTADPAIRAKTLPWRGDAIAAWCPSLIQGHPPAGQLRVLIFGMGHKRQIDKLERLKKLLEATGYDYTVEVSTGVHEGSPWDQSWQETQATLSRIFGHHLRLLGYLADDALVDAMRQCHLAALFFESGVRANNTTVWAALEAGMPLLTNLDHESPEELQHGVTVLDLFKTRSLLSQPLDVIAKAGQVAAHARSWPRLLSVLVA